jgi:hypothetical protein
VGIEEEIQVRHQGQVIRWRLRSPKPARIFLFTREQYHEAVVNLLRQDKQLIDRLILSNERKLVVTPNLNARVLPWRNDP